MISPLAANGSGMTLFKTTLNGELSMKRKTGTPLLLYCLCLLWLLPLQAMAKDSAIIVFDGSGSMWGLVDGKPKIEVARDVMGTLVQDWNEDINLGLMVYGHREKGSCDDIEMVVPVGAPDGTKVMQAIKQITPKGKTPISAALKQAAENLRYTEDPATVILISDGEESCNADPCAVAKELEGKGIHFTAHVIGFDIKGNQQAQEQLKCVAESTGGKFFEAQNTEGLKEALAETAKAVAEPPPPPPKPAPAPEKKKSAAETGLKVATVLTAGGEPLTDKLAYSVEKPEKNIEGKREQVSYSYDAQPVFKLPAGKYVVVVKYGDAGAEAEVEVRDGEAVSQTLVLNAGYLKMAALPKAGTKPLDDKLAYAVYTQERDLEGKRKQMSYSYDAQPLFRLPEGKYFVTVQHGDAETGGDVEVKAGQQTEQQLVLNVGYLSLSALPKEGAAPLADKLSYAVYTQEQDLEGKRKQVSYSYDAQPLFRLPAGKYFITVQHGEAETGGDFEVTAGERKEGKLVLNVGYLQVSTIPKEGAAALDDKLSYAVYTQEQDLEGKRKQLSYSYDAQPLFRLPQGHYFLTVKYGEQQASQEVEVTAGQRSTAVLNLAAPTPAPTETPAPAPAPATEPAAAAPAVAPTTEPAPAAPAAPATAPPAAQP